MSGKSVDLEENIAPDQAEALQAESSLQEDLPEVLEPEDSSSLALVALAKELEEQKDKFLRLAAEYDNYRKRTIREREEYLRLAASGLMAKLLPVVDTMARGVEANQQTDNIVSVREGLEKVQRQMMEILQKEGLSLIAETGVPFDANIHMAVFQEANDAVEDNTVLQVFESGYKLTDKVLRPAKVKVSKK